MLVKSDRETHKASFTVQASVSLQRIARAFEISDLRFEIAKRLLLVSKFYGQATKGTRWMPWHFEAMKDVASCEKLRLGASIL